MSRYHREHPTEPHPFARDVEYVSDAWREMQAEMKAEAGCVGDECDGCPECWVPELDAQPEQRRVMSDTEIISGGADMRTPVCPTCPHLLHDKKYPGWGWCNEPRNRVHDKGWVNGFTPSQSPTGTCNLHPERQPTPTEGEKP